MKILVESKYSIAEKIRIKNKLLGEHCISILDPEEKDIEGIDKHFSSVLKLRFHDICLKSEHDKETKPILFRRRHLRKIIKYYYKVKKAGSESIVVHCHAGVHRSTAIALILLYLELKDSSLARDELIKARAIPLPNKRIINMFDRRYKTSLMDEVLCLEDRFRKFVNNELCINQDDYLEELESVLE